MFSLLVAVMRSNLFYLFEDYIKQYNANYKFKCQ